MTTCSHPGISNCGPARIHREHHIAPTEHRPLRWSHAAGDMATRSRSNDGHIKETLGQRLLSQIIALMTQIHTHKLCVYLQISNQQQLAKAFLNLPSNTICGQHSKFNSSLPFTCTGKKNEQRRICPLLLEESTRREVVF